MKHATKTNELQQPNRSKKQSDTDTEKERIEIERRKRDLRKETIAILVEEAEGFLELGDLVVGELVSHWR